MQSQAWDLPSCEQLENCTKQGTVLTHQTRQHRTAAPGEGKGTRRRPAVSFLPGGTFHTSSPCKGNQTERGHLEPNVNIQGSRAAGVWGRVLGGGSQRVCTPETCKGIPLSFQLKTKLTMHRVRIHKARWRALGLRAEQIQGPASQNGDLASIQGIQKRAQQGRTVAVWFNQPQSREDTNQGVSKIHLQLAACFYKQRFILNTATPLISYFLWMFSDIRQQS